MLTGAKYIDINRTNLALAAHESQKSQLGLRSTGDPTPLYIITTIDSTLVTLLYIYTRLGVQGKRPPTAFG